MGIAFLFLLGDGDRDIPSVFDDVTEGFKAGFESGNADGGWSHIDAAAGLSEIERDADDADLFWGDRVGCGHRQGKSNAFNAENAEIAEEHKDNYSSAYFAISALNAFGSASGKSLTIRLIPSFSTRTWKFISKPTRLSARRR